MRDLRTHELNTVSAGHMGVAPDLTPLLVAAGTACLIAIYVSVGSPQLLLEANLGNA